MRIPTIGKRLARRALDNGGRQAGVIVRRGWRWLVLTLPDGSKARVRLEKD